MSLPGKLPAQRRAGTQLRGRQRATLHIEQHAIQPARSRVVVERLRMRVRLPRYGLGRGVPLLLTRALQACSVSRDTDTRSRGTAVQSSRVDSAKLRRPLMLVPPLVSAHLVCFVCPTGLSRIRVGGAVKGRNCRHPQPFDRVNYTTIAERFSRWECPVCAELVSAPHRLQPSRLLLRTLARSPFAPLLTSRPASSGVPSNPRRGRCF